MSGGGNFSGTANGEGGGYVGDRGGYGGGNLRPQLSRPQNDHYNGPRNNHLRTYKHHQQQQSRYPNGNRKAATGNNGQRGQNRGSKDRANSAGRGGGCGGAGGNGSSSNARGGNWTRDR